MPQFFVCFSSFSENVFLYQEIISSPYLENRFSVAITYQLNIFNSVNEIMYVIVTRKYQF